MAIGDLQKFQAALNSDTNLQTQAQAVLQQVKADSSLDWSPLIQLAAQHGYSFTAEELTDAFLSGDRELTEADLDQAIGAIDGSTGNDVIRGGGGNDTILGTTGNDIIRGGGGGGKDTIDGATGNDIIRKS